MKSTAKCLRTFQFLCANKLADTQTDYEEQRQNGRYRKEYFMQKDLFEILHIMVYFVFFRSQDKKK